MKPQLRFLIAASFIAALSAAVTYAVAGPPAGSPVQRTITYEGNLTDTQGALQATYPMQFSLWDSESGQQGKLWESNSTNMPVEQTSGRFIAVLGPAIGPELPDNVYETPSLWLGATIDAIPMPRQRIAAVPFAVRAEKAEVADVATLTEGRTSGCPSPGARCNENFFRKKEGPWIQMEPGGYKTSIAYCDQAVPVPFDCSCLMATAADGQLIEHFTLNWDKPSQWKDSSAVNRAGCQCSWRGSGSTGSGHATITCWEP